MSPVIVNASVFAEVMAEQGWADIDTLYMACKERNVFTAEFYDKAIAKASKDAIRRILKSGKVRDAFGRTINVASIIITDSKGEPRRVYKQETLFDVGDFVQVVNYWKGNKAKAQERLDYYVGLSVKMHGEKVRDFFDLLD